MMCDLGVPFVRHRRDSWPSHFHESGFFFAEEAVRTDLTEMLRAGARVYVGNEGLVPARIRQWRGELRPAALELHRGFRVCGAVLENIFIWWQFGRFSGRQADGRLPERLASFGVRRRRLEKTRDGRQHTTSQK